MDEARGTAVGRRLREIRLWRGLSLRATAELAGFSAGYLSMIERGLRPVDRRSTLEALAAALGVAPSDLAPDFPVPGRADALAPARARLPAISAVITDIEIGEGDRSVASWSRLSPALAELAGARRRGDCNAQAGLLPDLVVDLNAATRGAERTAVLRALVDAYQRTAMTAKTLGATTLPSFAALRARQAAALLDDPAWTALTAVTTAATSGRERAVAVADRAIDGLIGHLGDGRCREMAGALHLGAALAQAVRGDPDRAEERLAEATRLATGSTDGPGFGGLLFGPANRWLWRMSVAVESGAGGRVRELAAGWDVRAIPPGGTPTLDRDGPWARRVEIHHGGCGDRAPPRGGARSAARSRPPTGPGDRDRPAPTDRSRRRWPRRARPRPSDGRRGLTPVPRPDPDRVRLRTS